MTKRRPSLILGQGFQLLVSNVRSLFKSPLCPNNKYKAEEIQQLFLDLKRKEDTGQTLASKIGDKQANTQSHSFPVQRLTSGNLLGKQSPVGKHEL